MIGVKAAHVSPRLLFRGWKNPSDDSGMVLQIVRMHCESEVEGVRHLHSQQSQSDQKHTA